jgi:hypothetical protein
MTAKINFAHFRRVNPDDTINCRGGMTVAFIEEDGYFKYAMAHCHEKDNYNKSQGRAKASGRLNSQRYTLHFHGSREEFFKNLSDRF